MKIASVTLTTIVLLGIIVIRSQYDSSHPPDDSISITLGMTMCALLGMISYSVAELVDEYKKRHK